MDFGMALQELKKGNRVFRSNWNGKEIWLQLQVPDEFSKMTEPYLYIEYPHGHPAYPNGSKVPWVGSQTDVLGQDWEVKD
jgi:Protein of unknown function (DUF2829)